jgi:hypothetical protein
MTTAAALCVADYMVLHHRPDLHVLILRWTRPVTLTEFQDGFHRLAEEAEQHHSFHWLLDMRELLVSLDTGIWLQQEGYPALARRLSRTFHLAYLLSPTSSHLLRSNPDMAALLADLQQGCPSFCRFQLFDQEGKAQQWLASCQQEP